MKILQICPPHLLDVAALLWEIEKSHFQQYYSYIHHLRRPNHLRHLTRKQTVIHLLIPPENATNL